GGEVAVEVVVQLDPVEPGVLGEPEALFQGHLVRVREGPQVDGLLERVALPRGVPGGDGFRVGPEGGGAEGGGGGGEDLAAGDDGIKEHGGHSWRVAPL